MQQSSAAQTGTGQQGTASQQSDGVKNWDDDTDLTKRVSCICEDSELKYCMEYKNLHPSLLANREKDCAEKLCKPNTGIFHAGKKCDRENSAGGCLQGDPSEINDDNVIPLVIFYYQPKFTADSVKELLCDGADKYVAP